MLNGPDTELTLPRYEFRIFAPDLPRTCVQMRQRLSQLGTACARQLSSGVYPRSPA